jgi:hypothetical protein
MQSIHFYFHLELIKLKFQIQGLEHRDIFPYHWFDFYANREIRRHFCIWFFPFSVIVIFLVPLDEIPINVCGGNSASHVKKERRKSVSNMQMSKCMHRPERCLRKKSLSLAHATSRELKLLFFMRLTCFIAKKFLKHFPSSASEYERNVEMGLWVVRAQFWEVFVFYLKILKLRQNMIKNFLISFFSRHSTLSYSFPLIQKSR